MKMYPEKLLGNINVQNLINLILLSHYGCMCTCIFVIYFFKIIFFFLAISFEKEYKKFFEENVGTTTKKNF